MKRLFFCTHKVNKANIRRENRRGVEHIIITSYTLPPNIVMNGGLYPSEEIDKAFESFNRTPVTIEHPEIDGVFVSASDGEVDIDFRIGAFNENARRTSDGRVALDKIINVQKAKMTEKGKRLLDRIEEIETNENARPIHTSVGVFLDVEEVELTTNDSGQEYTWIARDIIADHDAILLDSVGAATPEQGTGIGINKESVKVMHYVCSTVKKHKNKATNYMTNDAHALSFDEIEHLLWHEINRNLEPGSKHWIIAVFDGYFIFSTPDDELFRSNYLIDDKNNLSIQDTRLPVERVIEFRTINPTENTEDNAMRDRIIEELGKMGITVNADISDADLMAKHNKALLAANAENADNVDETTELSKIVANAVTAAMKPLNEEISSLKSTFTANSDKELSELATLIVNSKKNLGLDEAQIKSLGLDAVKAMASNCGISKGIGPTMLIDNNNSEMVATKISDLPAE